MAKVQIKNLLIWLLTSICFVGIPAAILFFSIDKYNSMAEKADIEQFKLDFQQKLSSSIAATDKEKYWSKKLAKRFKYFFRRKTPAKNICRWLATTRKESAEFFNYLVWDSRGNIINKTFPADYSQNQWHAVFSELSQVFNKGWKVSWVKDEKTDIAQVRAILGPQYIGEMVEDNTNPKRYSFSWADSSLQRPPFWTFFTETSGCIIFFPYDRLNSNNDLIKAIANLTRNSEFFWGTYAPDSKEKIIYPADLRSKFARLAPNLLKCEKRTINFLEDNDYFLSTAFLTAELRLFAIARKRISNAQKRLLPPLASFILLLCSLPFLKYTFKTIARQKAGTVSLRPRLAFLFFFANALPFLAMAVFSQEYYQQKKSALLKDIHHRSVELLKDYDKRLETFHSKAEHNMQVFFDNWVQELQSPLLNSSDNEKASKAAKDNLADSFFVVASTSRKVGSYSGVNNVEESLAVKEKSSKKTKKQHSLKHSDATNSQIFNLIGKRVMNELNGISKSNQATTKLEILMESLLQKSFTEITHSFIKAMGGISLWGFGKSQSLTLLKFMRLPNSRKVDYMSVVLWSGKTFQDQYVLKTLPQINRNPIGLKIFARLDYAGKYFPKGFKPHEELKRYIDLATDRPGEEIEILSHKGEEYLAICFNGAMLSRYKLLGLYPLARLDRLIGRHKNDLIMLGVLSILLGLWLAQILAKGFLVPLDRLQSAALAIEQRKFDHQLEVKNKDEFGDIANVFQNVMHDLQELEVAKVVQEGLFPDRGLKQNRVNIFGRSVAMAELGGDYLDFFAISDEECGVLLGDVAGHGVGAALIMAMAKSGILSSQDHLSQPKKLLENLHKLILSSKTRKQRKIMTFQYLCINSNSGMVRYANAGGCSPLIVKNKGQSIKELTLAGAALGAFKKAKFNEIEFSLESGDAIVFYTDGIIEAHDPTGVEMGYERFAQLVKESWHANPETYYQRLYQEYLQHTGHQDAEDDLTLIVTNYI